MRQKNFEGNLDTSPSLLSINFFATRNFLKHSIEGVLYEMFRHCQTKNFRRKILILPLPLFIHKLIRYRKLSETQHKRVPLQSFLVERQKNSTENCDTPFLPPPLLSINFSDTRNSVKHRKVPRSFLALWDKNFSTENRDTLLHKVQNSVVELLFVKTLWKLISKQLFCF